MRGTEPLSEYWPRGQERRREEMFSTPSGYARREVFKRPRVNKGNVNNDIGRMWSLWCQQLQQTLKEVKVLVAQSSPTLCNTVDYSPPGSLVHGLLQARILEWITIPFSRGSSWPREWTQVSCLSGGFFTIWATWEGQQTLNTAKLLGRLKYNLVPKASLPQSLYIPSSF